MGGILSGLLGGITKGAIGGYTAEGERRRKEEDLGKNILTQMHMQRLNDWENLSPEEQNFHMGEIARIHKIKPEVLGTGIQLAHSLSTQLPAAGVTPPTPRTEPIGGVQKPVDIPANTQDLSPRTLPPPAIAPNAGLAPVPTLESLAGKLGIDPKSMTLNQRKALQAEILKQSDTEQARQAKSWEEEQGIQTNVNAMRNKLPDSELTNFETALRSKTYYQGQHQGTMSAPVAYENSKGQQFLIGHNGKTNKFFDAESGQMMDTLPPDLKPAARPRQFAPIFKEDINGNLVRLEKNIPASEQATGKGVTPIPGFKGKPFVPPVANVTYQTPGGLMTVPTPRNEAVAAGRTALKAAGGGAAPAANFNNPLTPQGQKALTDLLPVKAQFQGLMQDLEDIKDNNQPLTYLGDRGLYAIGRATDAAALISNLELAKITGAMPYAKASRNFQYFKQIQQHLGNVKTDSPKLLYSKLKNAMRNFDEMEKDIRSVDVKGALPTAGMPNPPGATAAAGGDMAQVREKATGKTGKIPRAKLQAAISSGKYEEMK